MLVETSMVDLLAGIKNRLNNVSCRERRRVWARRVRRAVRGRRACVPPHVAVSEMLRDYVIFFIVSRVVRGRWCGGWQAPGAQRSVCNRGW